MYWGVCSMIWASHGGGEHWQPVFGKAPAMGDDQTPATGHAIAVCGNGSVYAMDHDSVMRVSRDHGATWAELAQPPVVKNSRDTPAFPFFLADGTLCVSCRPSPGMAVSRDDGKTWQIQLTESIILNAQATSEGEGVVAFDSAGKLHRSSHGGVSFTIIKEVPYKWEPGLRFAGGLAAAKGGKVMLWSLEQLVVSSDGGQTWKHTLKTKNALSFVTSPSGQTWHDFHHDAPSYTARGFTYVGEPGSVIYQMFGNMARPTKLYD